ncbi:MAG: SDR family oxidoreductase [Bacteroidales bacterium]|nr:SDR family oxidoreductase [Bacteroidales bacterium]
MDNKVVIVTGASSGIGKALSELYASRGYGVVMAARNEEKLNSLATELEKQGGEVLPVKTDVSKEVDCKNLIDKALEKFNRIDILVNNAGISMRAMFKDTDLDVIRQLMDVNYWGTVQCTKYALPHVLKQQGSIVGVISIVGHVGLPARSGYASSKFAIRGFMDTLRIEHLKDGLHVLVAAPGFTDSNIRKTALTEDGTQQGGTPRNEGEMMSSEEVARRIAEAVDRRKRSLILTFKEGKLTVWLGKFFPKLLDKLTYNHMAKEPDSPLNKN